MSRTFRTALCAVIACVVAIALPMAAASATEPADARTSAAADTVEGPEVPVPELVPTAEPEKNVSMHADAKDWLSTAMNLGAIAFLIWMATLLWRPGLGRSLTNSKS